MATAIGALLTTLAAQAAAPRATPLDKPAARVVAAGGTASAVDVAYLQGRKPTAPDAITALGPDLFGDRLNLYNGSFSFEHTDISLPGNSALPVALTRTHSPGRSWQVRGVLADWDLNMPRIEGTFAAPEGWVTSLGGPQTRCSQFSAPPTVYRGYIDSEGFLHNTEFLPSEYWQGTFLVIPGQGSQEILANSRLPTENGRWPLTTRQQWQIGCHQPGPGRPSVQNAAGEGFVARSPDGVTYVFDWMASRQQRTLQKVNGLPRVDMFLMATRVSDRFGNWVSYHYDPARPMNLLRIEASDGRVITLQYSGDRLVSATDGDPAAAAPPPPVSPPPVSPPLPPGCPNCDHQRATSSMSATALRTWTYAYLANGDLGSVTQPDGHAWRFDLRGFVTESEPVNEGTRDCDGHPTPMGYYGVGTLTHPSGAVGRFEADYVYQPLSNVPRVCTYHSGEIGNWTNGSVYPRETISFSLKRKTVTAPGAAPMVWAYDGPLNLVLGSWAPCAGCPDRKTTQVTEPDGTVTKHEFGIVWRQNEGQLLRVEAGGTTSTPHLRTTTYRYKVPSPNEFPDRFGDSPNLLYDWSGVVNRPQDYRQIDQHDQAAWFRWQAHPSDGYDDRARVVQSTSTSSLGDSRSERTQYTDAYAHLGVVGLVESRHVRGTGAWLEAERNSFHTTLGQLHSVQEFGLPKARFEYHVDGTLRYLFDGKGNRTEFSNHRRGRPQRAVFADGSVATQVINNAGWTLEHTNEVGSRHQLEYDPMGRLTRVRYPTGDPVAYCDTVLSFWRAPAADRGLPAGHWRQRIETCGDVTDRWFDALWRERLERRYDAGSPGTTARTVEKRYDVLGQTIFTSQALRDIGAIGLTNAGTHIKRDRLGRTTEQAEEGTNGVSHTTKTEYRPGFLRRVTNPRKAVTTMSFQAFDEPVESSIRNITMPEGVTVSIGRDFLGKASSITRSGPSPQGLVSATRHYVYDAAQQLCKTIEPEGGATVRQFDAAGNLAWVAPGTALNTLACDASAAPEQRRIRYEYDTRNRLRWARQGDGNGQIERTYKADGLLERITSYRSGRHTLTWAYDYYNSREPKEERHTWGDPANFWSWSYQTDPRRQRRSYADAFGEVILDPDALGRPRRMGGYASNVSYHPDGSVAGYVLGNGITFRTTPDAFGRPEVWEHVGRSRQTYRYDPVGNVTSIDDAVDPMRSVSLPNYDLLDRLRQANGPWQRGSQQGGLFEYDGLDNIVRSTVGSRTLVHGMDRVRNRLSQLTGSQNLDFEYDSNGNITRRGNTYFTFDIANRMLSSTAHTGLDYDGHGRRALTWWAGGGYRHTAYTQDGLMRLDWRLHQGARRYIYLGGKLIAEQRDGSFGNEVTYSHADVLGSPMLRTNAAGAVVQTTVHEPYGATAAGWDVPARVGYTGHVNDPETGLVYMQQRYCDPIAGRFLSVDPVTTNPDDGNFFGRYHYANNNPYRFTDPTGMAPCGEGAQICHSIQFGQGDAGSPESNRQGRSNTEGDRALVAGVKVGVTVGVEVASAAIPPVRLFRGGLAAKGVGDYGTVLGHHVHAKRAFEGVAGYDRMKAFSVSDKALAEFGVRHADVTTAQQRLFRALDASGAPSTLTQHSRVAYQALVDAGVPANAAKQMVIQSQTQLIRSGVVEPARIPWGTR